MDLLEYQGKSLFARIGVPVPDGRVATTPTEAQRAAEEIGGRVVVKASNFDLHRSGAHSANSRSGPGCMTI